jgi:Protein of unknown function (DUF3570)
MQLNAPSPSGSAPALRLALAAATAVLLAPAYAEAQSQAATTTQADGAAKRNNATWQVDSAVLIYKEDGGRVTAVEPVVSLRRTDGNDRTLGLKLTYDSLTGASPNGAVPQPTAQTFTSPSGASSYTTPARAQPLDPLFKDSRVAVALAWEQPLGENQRFSLGGNYSTEYDFESRALSTGFTRDFNNKNTTVSAGFAIESNTIDPVGGVATGLEPAFNFAGRKKSDTRRVMDLLFGVTQVMNRRWVMQFNVGLGRASGYHSDSYKLLSVVDGTTGLLTGDQYVNERRPDSRSRQTVYWQNKYHLATDVVDASYRFYRDDWGMRAHTFDLRYRFQFAGGMHIEPQWRYYQQNAANFYRGWFVEGQDWNSATNTAAAPYASSETRLGAFSANTLGVKWGVPLGRAGEFSVRLAVYRQVHKKPAQAPGVLQSMDIAPTLTAPMLLVGYSLPL